MSNSATETRRHVCSQQMGRLSQTCAPNVGANFMFFDRWEESLPHRFPFFPTPSPSESRRLGKEELHGVKLEALRSEAPSLLLPSGPVDCGKHTSATWRQCDAEASRGTGWGGPGPQSSAQAPGRQSPAAAPTSAPSGASPTVS